MLSQLERLGVDADGRYATAKELQSFKDYLQSLDQRISAYQKIQTAEEEIIQQVKDRIRTRFPNGLKRGAHDMTSICRRDIGIVLRNTTAALLTNDLDRLRDRLLLWHQTIICSFKIQRISELIYQELQAVVKQYLTSDEMVLLQPILVLNSSLLR